MSVKTLPRSKMTKADIDEMFRRMAEAMPEPKSDLEYVNDYTLLVAVVLSAQATDVGVNKATKALFQTVQTPQAMLDLGEEALIDHIKTIGLYKAKAANVIKLSKILVEKYQGMIPHSREALESLPGVGRKTANVVLNIAFGENTIAVDTHCFRLANRTGIAPGKDVLEVELGLVKRVPAQYAYRAHHHLILHGRYVCKARKPECYRCLISDLCKFTAKTEAP